MLSTPKNFEFGLQAISYAGYTFEIPALIKDPATISWTYRRIGPKIGRNDPCPCGSGKNTRNVADAKIRRAQTIKARTPQGYFPPAQTAP